MDKTNVELSYRAGFSKKRPPPRPKGGRNHPQSGSARKPKPSRANDKNLKAIGASSAEDCCACIKALTEYIKEICKCVCCVSNGDAPETDTRFSFLFCELGDITIRLGHDVYNMLKYLFKCIGRILK